MSKWWLVLAIVCVACWQAYRLGYKAGLKGSPEYSVAIASKISAETEAKIARLEALANYPPTLEECLPIVEGSNLDEYSFCEELLSDRSMREDGYPQSEEPEPLPRY